jgi:biopolymer transport protein ExbD
MTFAISVERRPPRRPSLTPMIDVVFLLLVFFMLASRFSTDLEQPVSTAGGGSAYEGPPRLVDLWTDGLALNGVAMDEAEVIAELGRLTDSPEDIVILRAAEAVPLQALASLMDHLRAAGFARLVLVE